MRPWIAAAVRLELESQVNREMLWIHSPCILAGVHMRGKGEGDAAVDLEVEGLAGL